MTALIRGLFVIALLTSQVTVASTAAWAAEGEIDDSFASVSSDASLQMVRDVAPLGSDKILVASSNSNYCSPHSENSAYSVVCHYLRTNPLMIRDGSTWASMGKYIHIRSTQIEGLPDGRWIAGSRDSPTTSTIVRLNSNGTLDDTFQAESTPGILNDFDTLPDGGAIGISTPNLGGSPNRLVRWRSDGSVDTRFGLDVEAILPGDRIFDVEVEQDGGIIVAGPNFLVRLTPLGSLDPTFSSDVAGLPGFLPGLPGFLPGRQLALQPEGGVVLAINDLPTSLVRLNPDGSRDPTFAPRLPGRPTLVSIQADGKILIGGWRWLMRLQPDGRVDPLFNNGLSDTGMTPLATAEQRDGKVLVGGAGKGPILVRLGTGLATPSRPTGVSVIAGDEMFTMAFAPPDQLFGLTVERYEYSLDGGPWLTLTGGGEASPASVTGLTNGQLYLVRLRAVTAAGVGGSALFEVTPAPPRAGRFVAIDPVRVYDSRWPETAKTAGLELGPLANSSVSPQGRMVPAYHSRDAVDGGVVATSVVPEGATAIAYNLTATGQTSSGFLSLSPADSMTAPNSSVLNWTAPGQTRANGFVAAVNDLQQVRVHVGGSGATQFILDVVGYYLPPPKTPQGSLFVPLDSPMRVYDGRWRDVPDVITGPIRGPEGRVVSVKDARDSTTGAVRNADVVPEGATSIAYNLTITGSTGTGFLAATPGDQMNRPAVSTINWSPGVTVANATSVKVSPDRTVKVFAVSGGRGGRTTFILDVVGYYIPASAVPAEAVGSEFVAVPPTRAYDSRSGNPMGVLFGDPSTGGVGVGRTTSAGALPPGTSAVAFNVTVTGNSGSGFVEVSPGGKPYSGTSTINWTAPNTLANGSVVGVDGQRRVTAFTGGYHSTHYLIDIAGYFQPTS